MQQRRAELFAAAKQVVLERGLSHTRVADVAEATQVSGGLIHYHFATKDILLTEMLRHEAEVDIAKARRLTQGSGSATSESIGLMREFVPSARSRPDVGAVDRRLGGWLARRVDARDFG